MGEGESELAAMRRMVSSVDMKQHAGFTVVEVRSVEQAVTAAAAWDASQSARGGDERVVLLLDNMGSGGASDAGTALSERGLRQRCVLEGSGGVSLDSLGDWAASGVDLVSSSALNRGVEPLDLSMLIGTGGD
jgi:nicotinate-nucleotide pyrophosphorylase (carboxylating)